MAAQNPRLGDCPRCGSEIRHGHALIEYESGDDPCVWAACPDCDDVVDPE